MALPKLLIADPSDAFCQALEQALADRFQVYTCQDGKQTLSFLRETPCEILVLNLLLPEDDGITLLEKLAAENISPKVLAITSLWSDYIQTSVENLNVCYAMRKPFPISSLVRRVCDLDRPLLPPLPTRDMYVYLSEVLSSFPMKPKLLGYKLLRAAILISVQNPNLTATKELYPAAAAFCGRKDCNVERNMRTALDTAWANPNREVWLRYFPPSDRRPESSDFISRLAQDLRLKQSQGLLDPYKIPDEYL